MFFKNILNKKTIKIGVSLVCASIVYKNFTEKHASQHYAAGYNYSRRYYPASSEYPELKRNRNIMARSLTSQLYAKLRDLRTPNGFTVDDAIQTGVDNIGKFSFTGIVAGDEESYQVGFVLD
jgi:creatine kinase